MAPILSRQAMHPVALKSHWATYRSNITEADTTPVGLDTPANCSTNYHHAESKPASPIDLSLATRLDIRARTSANVTIFGVLILWDKTAGTPAPGRPVGFTLKATGKRTGNGNTGDYLAELSVPIDIGGDSVGHIFLDTIPSGTVTVLETRPD